MCGAASSEESRRPPPRARISYHFRRRPLGLKGLALGDPADPARAAAPGRSAVLPASRSPVCPPLPFLLHLPRTLCDLVRALQLRSWEASSLPEPEPAHKGGPPPQLVAVTWRSGRAWRVCRPVSTFRSALGWPLTSRSWGLPPTAPRASGLPPRLLWEMGWAPSVGRQRGRKGSGGRGGGAAQGGLGTRGGTARVASCP